MITIHNELYGSLVVTMMFMFISYVFHKNDKENSKYIFMLKGGLTFFVVSYFILYFISSSSKNEVLMNVIQTEPDF